MTQTKKPYSKPELLAHGSVEAITGYAPGGGTHDVFGGGFLSPRNKATAKKQGPADFGS